MYLIGDLRFGFTFTVRLGFGLGLGLARGVAEATPPTGGAGRVVGRVVGCGTGGLLDATGGIGVAGLGLVDATASEPPITLLLRHQRPLLRSSAQRST